MYMYNFHSRAVLRGLYGLRKSVELRVGPCEPIRYAVRSPTGTTRELHVTEYVRIRATPCFIYFLFVDFNLGKIDFNLGKIDFPRLKSIFPKLKSIFPRLKSTNTNLKNMEWYVYASVLFYLFSIKVFHRLPTISRTDGR